MDWKHIELKKTGKGNHIAKLMLNRPGALNATCDEMVAELYEAVSVIENDPEIYVVIFGGNGKAFCAGGDLKEQADTLNLQDSYKRMNLANKTAQRLVNLERPVIGMVQGAAVGAGFSLALVGDIVYAADNAKFGALFNQVGLVPDMGCMYLLPQLVGRSKAKELLLTGRMVKAQEAKDIGLVNKVLPLEELEKSAMELAQQLADGPRFALQVGKKAINRICDLSFEDALALEQQSQVVCFMSKDHEEGVAAFLEKRQPKFEGI